MTEQEQKDKNVEHFLDLNKQSNRGKLKIYIGMSAGVGKTYRMLQEAHSMIKNGINVQIGYIETHNRKETQDLVAGLPFIPRRQTFYKGKQLDEMDINSIFILKPEWVIIDELAHTNIPGSKNEKRWQDVQDILNEGINVITAVNIQHIESINEEIKKIAGIEVNERVPDSFLKMADEVVNIDLTAEELITRLKEGKIYDKSKVELALKNFFKPEKILQLRELALKEVATQVVRKIETEVPRPQQLKQEHFLACISSNNEVAKKIIRKTARLANYYNSKWYVLYIQTPNESANKIALDKQRHLINNYKLAIDLGAEVIQSQIKSDGTQLPVNVPFISLHSTASNIVDAIMQIATEKEITTICIGKPHLNMWQILLKTSIFNHLLKGLSENDIDLIILS